MDKYKWEVAGDKNYIVNYEENGVKTFIAVTDTAEKAHCITHALNSQQKLLYDIQTSMQGGC